MCAAVEARRNWSCGNTRVQVRDGGNWVKVFLFDNLIYTDCQESGERRFTLAGWNTTTTRNRLNALGVGVSTRKDRNSDVSIPRYNGQAIDKNKWYIIK